MYFLDFFWHLRTSYNFGTRVSLDSHFCHYLMFILEIEFRKDSWSKTTCVLCGLIFEISLDIVVQFPWLGLK